MNFIIKLSKFKKLIMKFRYNLIIIVVNRFIKKVYFILFHEKIRAMKVAYLFEQHIIANHEVSAEIISDKDIWFKLKFWQILTTLKKIKIKMSTTKYSQINEQIEWFNQIVKQYLKCYVNYQQNNWVKLLSAA